MTRVLTPIPHPLVFNLVKDMYVVLLHKYTCISLLCHKEFIGLSDWPKVWLRLAKVGILHNLYKAESMDQLHLEDAWIPAGFQVESMWTPDGF